MTETRWSRLGSWYNKHLHLQTRLLQFLLHHRSSPGLVIRKPNQLDISILCLLCQDRHFDRQGMIGRIQNRLHSWCSSHFGPVCIIYYSVNTQWSPDGRPEIFTEDSRRREIISGMMKTFPQISTSSHPGQTLGWWWRWAVLGPGYSQQGHHQSHSMLVSHHITSTSGLFSLYTQHNIF